jgi:hypothetical protein
MKSTQDGGLKGFFHLSHHLEFFEKLFSTKLASSQPTPNECKKKIKKMDTLGVMSKNLILIRHFGSNRHF